jgi:hypothetical protein
MRVEFITAPIDSNLYSFIVKKCDTPFEYRIPHIEEFLKNTFKSVKFSYTHDCVTRMFFTFNDIEDEAFFQMYLDDEIEI